MNLDFTAFQEPRGVMRVLHLIFSICAFATVTGYTGNIHYKCFVSGSDEDNFSYPFFFSFNRNYTSTGPPSKVCDINIISPPTSDVIFFVTTGVLTMLYTLVVMVVYGMYNAVYKKDNRLPLLDFLLTVFIGVLWLSSSAAWANSLTGIKEVTNPTLQDSCADCSASSGNFSTLNISVILGFLNFFLWAANLWFVYKETAWFQGAQQQTVTGV